LKFGTWYYPLATVYADKIKSPSLFDPTSFYGHADYYKNEDKQRMKLKTQTAGIHRLFVF
jgi:hypothetical protein